MSNKTQALKLAAELALLVNEKTELERKELKDAYMRQCAEVQEARAEWRAVGMPGSGPEYWRIDRAIADADDAERDLQSLENSYGAISAGLVQVRELFEH